MSVNVLVYFFFQAEDGIRDVAVTGVQTCALPICRRASGADAGPRPAAGTTRFTTPIRSAVAASKIGRAAWRERVEISVVAAALKKKKMKGQGAVSDSYKDRCTQHSTTFDR